MSTSCEILFFKSNIHSIGICLGKVSISLLTFCTLSSLAFTSMSNFSGIAFTVLSNSNTSSIFTDGSNSISGRSFTRKSDSGISIIGSICAFEPFSPAETPDNAFVRAGPTELIVLDRIGIILAIDELREDVKVFDITSNSADTFFNELTIPSVFILVNVVFTSPNSLLTTANALPTSFSILSAAFEAPFPIVFSISKSSKASFISSATSTKSSRLFAALVEASLNSLVILSAALENVFVISLPVFEAFLAADSPLSAVFIFFSTLSNSDTALLESTSMVILSISLLIISPSLFMGLLSCFIVKKRRSYFSFSSISF